jgi:hypothetical protein
MILSAEERKKFADYLEQDARDTEGIIGQLQNAPGMDPLARKLKVEATAQRIVAAKLRSMETMGLETDKK